MVGAIVIASIALVFAVAAVPVWGWSLLRRNHKTLLASVRDEVEVATKKVTFALEQLAVSRENYDVAVENARKMRERQNAHFVTADVDATRADRRLTELEGYIRSTLEHQAASGSKPLILRGGLYAQQLSVMDAMPGLLDSFLKALGAQLMFREDDGPDGSTFYVRWPADKPAPRDLLGDTARAAAADDSAGSKPQPGTTELRAVLQAWNDGGLGVLYLGPLILVRTKTCLSAGFVKPGFQRLDEDQKAIAVTGSGPSLISQLNVAVFLELKQ